MASNCGWAGTILNVDLSKGEIAKEELSPAFARKFLGASGFNSIKLFERVGPEVDALSRDNILAFGTGPLSGTLAPGSVRLTITAKSPLTDIFGDSNMGGSLATELKFAGYDQIVFSGKANRPAYLLVDDDKVELKEASHLWGKSTWESAMLIKEEVGDSDLKVICIGQAGENLVRCANIIEPTRHAAGRSGMGAVMGSKYLKAIAVRGSGDVRVARPGEFAQVCKQMREQVIAGSPTHAMWSGLGSPAILDTVAPGGKGGVRNFQSSLFPNWQAISGKTFARDFSTAHKACPACFVACCHFHSIRSGEYAGVYGEGPEFGLTGMGLRCGIDSMPALLKINELLNQCGIDSYVAVVMAWAMECYEKGILSDGDFDGTPLRFGDYHAFIEMIPKIANREGFGNILAEGEKRAPLMVGKGSDKLMYHVKGLGLISHDPRANKQFALQYLTATRGADHLKGSNLAMFFLRDTAIGKDLWSDPEILDINSPKGKGASVKWCEDMCSTVNASGLCYRNCGSLELLTLMVSSATGIDFSNQELLETGERIFNVQKAFNSRQGLNRKDDNFSNAEKFNRQPLREGPYRGSVVERDYMLNDYYDARGWDRETGLQTRKKLAGLGLEDVSKALNKTHAVQ